MLNAISITIYKSPQICTLHGVCHCVGVSGAEILDGYLNDEKVIL